MFWSKWFLLSTDDVFKMRQEKAAALKIQIERAEKISEAELVELRADVKVRFLFSMIYGIQEWWFLFLLFLQISVQLLKKHLLVIDAICF